MDIKKIGSLFDWERITVPVCLTGRRLPLGTTRFGRNMLEKYSKEFTIWSLALVSINHEELQGLQIPDR